MPSFATAGWRWSEAEPEGGNGGDVVSGAGGIGIELQVSMELFRYAEASTIIIAIFAPVIAVERVRARLRRRMI